ncbi:alkaline phosphatase family protein [Actinobacteria bacterium YIM 96077]|uniref:Alkaline phosphatase family protein n=1 Tax=Phytoactinopolyspora halophila TaxID=1981511 RepID=A0A329QLY7_9ACTN|nr:alkaline phosphatase family protein [Phytoactinopolyspora halophila]AYY13503.1 alkaline phosphatase family protein [Actinobacteria bacterium YIM 96077]RAW12442.1 alkaline phosphatase family protein [Phytoactinopolyspora halophila]
MTLVPEYGHNSLPDIVPSILGALGVPGEQNPLGLPDARRYCILLIDGLGWNLLRAHRAYAPFLSSLPGRAITCATPSTTATSITSLGTGLAPGRHGVLGYTTRVPGGNEIFNALKWEPAIDPVTYQPHPTLFERAHRDGIAACVLGMRRFRDTGLTNAALRGPFHAVDTFGERVAAAAGRAGEGESALVYVYDPDLDMTGHVHGCGSAAWRHQLVMVDRFAEELYEALPEGTELVVTGDHGMVDVPSQDRIDVDEHPRLRDGVSLIAGEARFRHVYTIDGAADDVAAAWQEMLGEHRAAVLRRSDAIEAGWFGAVENRVLDRIGDVLVSFHGPGAVEHGSAFPMEKKLVGLHGGGSEDEMLVPLLLPS